MKTLKILLIISSLSLASCVIRQTPIANTNFNEVDFSNLHMYEKGKSCKRFLLGFIPLPLGQPSLYNAVKNGKLANVKIVDYEDGWVLIPPFYKRCLVAYGTR